MTRRANGHFQILLDGRAFSAAQRQTVVDFLWLCDQVPEAVAHSAIRRVTPVLADNRPEDVVGLLRELNGELRLELLRRPAVPDTKH